jgi:hypothetical protein
MRGLAAAARGGLRCPDGGACDAARPARRALRGALTLGAQACGGEGIGVQACRGWNNQQQARWWNGKHQTSEPGGSAPYRPVLCGMALHSAPPRGGRA